MLMQLHVWLQDTDTHLKNLTIANKMDVMDYRFQHAIAKVNYTESLYRWTGCHLVLFSTGEN